MRILTTLVQVALVLTVLMSVVAIVREYLRGE